MRTLEEVYDCKFMTMDRIARGYANELSLRCSHSMNAVPGQKTFTSTDVCRACGLWKPNER